jgi:hypothetical protein
LNNDLLLFLDNLRFFFKNILDSLLNYHPSRCPYSVINNYSYKAVYVAISRSLICRVSSFSFLFYSLLDLLVHISYIETPLST